MYQYAKPVDWFVKEMRYCIYDSTISHIDKEELFDVVKFAHKEWVSGKKVLIRCQAGLNRSGLVMALVLIREGYTPADAVRLIRKNRSSYALCNDKFLEWLLFGINPEDWRAEHLVEVAAA
jgi:protein-tyrosine phosphatase